MHIKHLTLLIGAVAVCFTGPSFARGFFFGHQGDEVEYADIDPLPLGGEERLDGSATLVRSDEGATFSLNTRGLEPNQAYTLWLMAFNKPENCQTPCDCRGVDAGNPDVELGVFWANGRVSDDYGQLEFSANVEYGEVPDGENQVLIDKAMERQAQTLLVIRTHGEASDDPAELETQLSTHSGACIGPGSCTDLAAANFSGPWCELRRKFSKHH